MVLRENKIFSSEDYPLLNDEAIVKELIERYGCEVVSGNSATAEPVEEEIEEIVEEETEVVEEESEEDSPSLKPVDLANTILETPKDLTVAGKEADKILISLDRYDRYLFILQIILQSYPDKQFIVATSDRNWDILRAENIKMIHPMKIDQFMDDVDEYFDLDNQIDSVDFEEYPEIDLLKIFNELIGMEEEPEYKFEFISKPKEIEHTEIQAKKFLTKKKKLVMQDSVMFDHPDTCDILRLLVQQGWCIAVIGDKKNGKLPRNRMIQDYREKFKDHEIQALLDQADAYFLDDLNDKYFYNFACAKDIDKKFMFLACGFYYPVNILKHYKNGAHLSLSDTFIKEDSSRCEPCNWAMKACDRKYGCYKDLDPIHIATRFRNAYETIMNKKGEYEEPNFKKETE